MALDAVERKSRGAYYTDGRVASFLARWAVRTPQDVVLEPSFGEGVFLRAVFNRIKEMGGDARSQLWGVELAPDTFQQTADNFPAGLALLCRDFFDLTPLELPRMDAVVGNPPFIRYQRFAGQSRRRALREAEKAGVTLPELASAWAPFLVHATRFLNYSGRLAVVAPYEILYAKYSRPVVRHLADGFHRLLVLTFQERLFPELNENTVLILGDGWGMGRGEARLLNMPSIAELDRQPAEELWRRSTRIDLEAWRNGEKRLTGYTLPTPVQSFYARFRDLPGVKALGEIAEVQIGYVTGANEYFHLSRQEADSMGIPTRALKPALRRGADLNRVGIAVREEDWREMSSAGKYCLFLPEAHPDESSSRYIALGEQKGIPSRYKCRVRQPWFVVPGVIQPDLFLTVFAHHGPRLVANQANLVATNTLLTVRLKEKTSGPLPLVLAASSLTSLAQLSAEIEGHALGGGALKLEPGEAKRWLLPTLGSFSAAVLEDLDQALRQGHIAKAHDIADRLFLSEALELSDWDIEQIREATEVVREARRRRRKIDAR